MLRILINRGVLRRAAEKIEKINELFEAITI